MSIDIDETDQTPTANGAKQGERASHGTTQPPDAGGEGETASSRPADGGKSTGELRDPDEPAADTQSESNIEGTSNDIIELTERLHDLKQLERELSLAQRWTQGRITELRDALGSAIGNGDPRLISELLLSLANESKEAQHLGRELDAPVPVIEEVLEELATAGVVDRDGHEWYLDA
ncbi:hypothetical protein [Halovenus aranensis]